VPVSLWARIKDHKIIQWALGYLAAALALTHAEELVAHAYGWPESIGQILIAVLGIGLPVTVTLAWYHGHRASRHVTGAEATIIAILLLLGAGFLWLFVRPQEPAPTKSVAEHTAAPTMSARGATTAAATASSAGASLVTAPASGKPRIAILPFENLSPDPKDAFFTDGLHEEIISTLSSRAPDIEVISRTTMMTYRTPKPAPEIARELGATHVLEGSVRREGNEVRLTLQLIDATRDQHLWSQDYNRTLRSALTLQSEVANVVASQLSSRLARGAEQFKPPTDDPQAYDLYLKAKLPFDQSNVGPSTPLELVQKLERLLDTALERDPSFAAAHVLRARVRMTYFLYNYDLDGHAMRLAREDLEAAERLAPGAPDVMWLRARFLGIDRNFEDALTAFDAAYSAGLTDPVELGIESVTLASAGRVNDAIQRAERARALDPRNPRVMQFLATILLMAGRSADAVRILDFGVAEFPELFQSLRATVVWGSTGSPGALNSWASVTPHHEISAMTDVASLNGELAPLRVQHRYSEIADLLNRATAKTIRSYLGVGQDHPLAELKGWTHLLLRDEVGAAQDGRAILDFVAHRKETKWNRELLRLLTAEGHLFTGDKVRAVAAAGGALDRTPFNPTQLTPQVAAVYAWGGAQDEASALLEQLSTAIPTMLAPALVTRDPLYAVPLAENARYKALQTKLEAQMAATKLE
jgi:TolB-like protein